MVHIGRRSQRAISAAALSLSVALVATACGSSTSGEASGATQGAAMTEAQVKVELAGNLPADVKAELNSAPALSMGQPVPGHPNGVKPTSPDFFHFSQQDIQKLKAGHFTAAIAMHEMDIGWSKLQLEGIKNTLKKFGINVVGVTNADFNAATQVNNINTLLARHPDVIFSIPVNPKTEASAYQNITKAGSKLVLMDNVPPGMAPGKDYVTVVAGNNKGDGQWAARELVHALGNNEGKKSQVGFLGIGYEFYTINQRDNAVLDVFHHAKGVETLKQTWSDPKDQVAKEASSMLISHPNLAGMWTSYTLPAASVVSAEKSQGRKVLLATSDLDRASALQVAQGWITASGAQQPYNQGVAEAKAAAYAFLGKKVPPFIELGTVPVTRKDLIPAYQKVTHSDPPAEILKALKQPPVQQTF
jgi:ribose transport system substrate-binding protein